MSISSKATHIIHLCHRTFSYIRPVRARHPAIRTEKPSYATMSSNGSHPDVITDKRDVLVEILSHVDLDDLRRCALVCHSWRSVLGDVWGALWRRCLQWEAEESSLDGQAAAAAGAHGVHATQGAKDGGPDISTEALSDGELHSDTISCGPGTDDANTSQEAGGEPAEV
eukprot:scaffold132829_cov37-Prasinocladus_malaysianus.AAC.1